MHAPARVVGRRRRCRVLHHVDATQVCYSTAATVLISLSLFNSKSFRPRVSLSLIPSLPFIYMASDVIQCTRTAAGKGNEKGERIERE